MDKKYEPAPKHIEQGKQRWFAMHLSLIFPLLDVFTINKESGRYPEFSHIGKFENGREELFDSMMRHAAESQSDPLAKDKTGTYHLANVAANALMRLHDAMLGQEEISSLDKDLVDPGLAPNDHDIDALDKTNLYTWVCSNCGVKNDNSNIYTCPRCGHRRC